MPLIWGALVGLWLAAVKIFELLGGAEVRKYAFRALMVALLASTFYAAFGVAYAQVDALIASALVAANASTGAAAGAFAFFGCMLPPTTAAAFAVLIDIMLIAVLLKWARHLMFAKLG